MRRRRALEVIVVVGLAMVVPAVTLAETGAGAAGDGPEPRARAWVVVVSSAAAEPVALVDVAVQAGAVPAATATPFALGGASPLRATADPDTPEDVTTPLAWDDPSGSGHVEGGYAEAAVTGSSSRGRAGLGTGAGTGFAIADALLSWEQQAQLIGSWDDANGQLAGAANDALGALTPALEPAGVEAPHVEGMAGLGWIDAVNVHDAVASAEAGASPGFATARADAAAARVVLLGGFITIDDVAAEAISESVSGVDDRRAVATVGEIRVAGIALRADADGLHLAGNDLPGGAGLDGILVGALLDQLSDTGIDLHVGRSGGSDDLRAATALELSIAGPDGTVLVSVGHAEASSVSVGAAPESAPVAPTPTPPAPPSVGAGASTSPTVPPAAPAPAASGDSVAPSTPADPPVLPGTPTSTAIDRRLSPDVVRAVRTGFLIVIAAGLAGAALVPVAMGSRTTLHQLLDPMRSPR